MERPGEPKPDELRERALAKVSEGREVSDEEEVLIVFDGLDQL